MSSSFKTYLICIFILVLLCLIEALIPDYKWIPRFIWGPIFITFAPIISILDKLPFRLIIVPLSLFYYAIMLLPILLIRSSAIAAVALFLFFSSLHLILYGLSSIY